jgi:hypothetical protein
MNTIAEVVKIDFTSVPAITMCTVAVAKRK